MLHAASDAAETAWRLTASNPLALFERGATLLDQGKYRLAYEAFSALHRIDREWPFLLEWLVRARAHWLREEKSGQTIRGNKEYLPCRS